MAGQELKPLSKRARGEGLPPLSDLARRLLELRRAERAGQPLGEQSSAPSGSNAAAGSYAATDPPLDTPTQPTGGLDRTSEKRDQ